MIKSRLLDRIHSGKGALSIAYVDDCWDIFYSEFSESDKPPFIAHVTADDYDLAMVGICAEVLDPKEDYDA